MCNLTVRRNNMHALILSLTNFFRLDHWINTPFEKQILLLLSVINVRTKPVSAIRLKYTLKMKKLKPLTDNLLIANIRSVPTQKRVCVEVGGNVRGAVLNVLTRWRSRLKQRAEGKPRMARTQDLSAVYCSVTSDPPFWSVHTHNT